MHAPPPTLTLPHKGGGNGPCSGKKTPSPLMGEGWGGGETVRDLSKVAP
jgi:hypothetical protein